MANKKTIKSPPLPTREQLTKHIEEAAYYSWLNRGRCSQVGDELNDWIAAEKEVHGNHKLALSGRSNEPSYI